MTIFVIKSHNLVKKCHQTTIFSFKKSQTNGVNYTTKQKLVNLNYQTNTFIAKITNSKYLGQDVGDGLQPNHYHCVEIH